MAPLLEIRELTKFYGERRVLDRVSLAVAEGEFVCIVGASGSGKSTLLSVLAGLLKADSGSITLDGKPLDGPGLDRGVVFQHYSLLPWLTARGNVRLAVEEAFPAESAKHRDERVQRVLDLVELGAAGGKLPRQLSGGMKQRVAVARALAAAPRILLLDEPFGALDALTRASLQEELERIHAKDRRTVVMITNDVDEALLLADRVVVLRDGRLEDATEVSLPRPRSTLAEAEAHRYRALRDTLSAKLRRDEAAAVAPAAASPSPVSDRAPNAPLLELRSLSKSFETPHGLQAVVKDVELSLKEGEFVSLVGHSGCGKTTVLSMVAGLTAPTSGEIRVDGKPVSGPGADRAMVFQAHALLPWLTAEGNVRLGVDQAYPDASEAERSEKVERALERVGLKDARKKRPADLSAGMRQRVGVARAFALSPKLLLLDEPFGSLDSVTRGELREVLLELWSRTGVAALLVTHDVDEAILLSDRIAVMGEGPEARIVDVVRVNLPRPRRAQELADHPGYRVIHERVLESLAHGEVRRTRSGEHALPGLATQPEQQEPAVLSPQ
ncbi:MAG: ABC transporter ATP-binding protein [Myxococcales bacterium]